MYDLLRVRYHFPGIRKRLHDRVSQCECRMAKAKLKKRQLITRPLLTQYPWYYVHIDLWEPGVISTDGHRYVLTVIDRFTRYPEMIPIKDKSAETVARAFFEQVICRHGTCAHVVSDNGSEFCNEVFDVMNRLFGVKRIRTAPYNPRANAPVERLVCMASFEGPLQLWPKTTFLSGIDSCRRWPLPTGPRW